jgi:hypothetical protein
MTKIAMLTISLLVNLPGKRPVWDCLSVNSLLRLSLGGSESLFLLF